MSERYTPKRDGWPSNPLIYEIYPRSFYDSTGSGEGDLKGITEKLPYVASLGVDAIWVAPFYCSPMDDGGYDISDHLAVDPRFGTLEDFDEMVETAHGLGLKVMIDQVLNHVSSEHPWFQKSVEGEDQYADWFVWRDPKSDGTAPNNWVTIFGRPAWTWSPYRRQYYLHQYAESQPSLNLEHDEVKEQQNEVVRFWAARGIDGFRFDALGSFITDPELKDNPPATEEQRASMQVGLENVFAWQLHEWDMLPQRGQDVARRLRKAAGPEMYMLGEMNSLIRGVELCELHSGEEKMDACYGVEFSAGGISSKNIAKVLKERQMDSAYAFCFGCHDTPRIVTAQGDGSIGDAKFLGLVAAAMPGPWILWQGDELGLPQADLTRNEIIDLYDRFFYPVHPGRDGTRVPMPWDDDKTHHGFTEGTPWLSMVRRAGIPVQQQEDDPVSALSFFRRLIEFRKRPALRGSGCTVEKATDQALILRRSGEKDGVKESMLCVFNFGPGELETPIDRVPDIASGPVTGNLPARTGAIWVEED
ncbi:alpha-amylase family glycosyl hydrolase [Roseicyclus sp. F158]|uniref:Alpha-amylase family glycosyl hydrolase n=1 Tax=Tropicimonas omnivorans TaxID=3075590 RepID=A0ABU3DCC6_9RHOB|nr:alpha-amylase family glycosyl hydrolase [Roseicyclus sp. F158]MDT0681361.1 alpha-amylase family glycosyl hydrolase [Roseicyclus sp. F158]